MFYTSVNDCTYCNGQKRQKIWDLYPKPFVSEGASKACKTDFYVSHLSAEEFFSDFFRFGKHTGPIILVDWLLGAGMRSLLRHDRYNVWSRICIWNRRCRSWQENRNSRDHCGGPQFPQCLLIQLLSSTPCR